MPLCSQFISFLFADDTTLLLSHHNFEILINLVNSELKKITKYFRSHKLSLHLTKTKFMIFSNSPSVRNLQPQIFLDYNNDDEHLNHLIYPLSQIIPTDSNPYVRFLGVLIDTNLSYQYHIKNVSSKLAKTLFILRKSKNILTQQALKSVYFSLFHSHLIYCLPIWSTASNSLLKPVIQQQKAAIRILSNSAYNAHSEPLFKNLEILPFNALVNFFNLQIIPRYKQGYLPVAFDGVWTTNLVRRGGDQQDRILRNSENLNIPFARLSFSLKQPLINLPKSWILFEEESIKIIQNKSEFNIKLKNHLLSKLESVARCNRLLCPVCHLGT